MRFVVIQKIEDCFGLRVVELCTRHCLHALHLRCPLRGSHTWLQAGVKPVTFIAFCAEQPITLLNVGWETGRVDFYYVSILSELPLNRAHAGQPHDSREEHATEQANQLLFSHLSVSLSE